MDLEDNLRKRERKRCRVWLDVVLIIVSMIISVIVRLPAASLSGISEEDRVEFVDENGTPYLKEMDSYHFVKKMNIILGNEQGKLNTFDNVLPFIGAVVYKILNVFGTFSVEQIAAFIGPFIFMFSCIPAYCFVKRKTNRTGGFIAALLIGITPALVVSTEFLIFDTDILLAVLPLTAFYYFVKAVEVDDKKKITMFFSIMFLCFVILGFAWHSASVYCYLAFVVVFVYFCYSLLACRFKIKEAFKTFRLKRLMIFFSSLLLCLLALVYFGFMNANLRVFGVNHENDIYPDSGLFVSELKSIPFFAGEGGIMDLFSVQQNGYVNILGGLGLIIAAASACVLIILLLIPSKKINRALKIIGEKYSKKENIFTYILLVVWFLGAFVALFRGARFVKIAAIPVCLLAGMLFGILFDAVHEKKSKVLLTIAAMIAILPSFGSLRASMTVIPGANHSLDETAEYINSHALDKNKEALVVTWWDLGYFYEYKGLDVLFDGGTQGGGYLYWVSTALMTDEPKLSEGIIRMLGESGSGLDAMELAIEMEGYDVDKADALMKEVLVLKKDKAKDKLMVEYGFSEEVVDRFLNFTHPETEAGSEKFVVITEDMISKLNTIGYYGLYNLEKGESEFDALDFETVNNSMIMRLYGEQEKIGNFKFMTAVDDRLGMFSARIWVLEDNS